MKQNDSADDSNSPVADPAPKKIPAWAKAPIFMYLSMVAAFAVAGVFVVYYVIRLTHLGQ